VIPRVIAPACGGGTCRKNINHFLSRMHLLRWNPMSGNGQTKKAVVPLPDLHIQSDVFCRAQDLLILFDDEPALVRPAELAEMVREMLTEPHWNCAADPSIVPTAHRAMLPAQNGLRRTG